MPSGIPDRIRLKIHHTLKFERADLVTMRSTYRETTYTAERPPSGQRDVAVECGYCGRPYVYRVFDRAQTQRLRNRTAAKSLAWSAALAALIAVLFTGIFGDGFLVFLVGFLAAVGLLVAVLSTFAGYADEIGVVNVTSEVLQTPERKVRYSDQAEGSCRLVTEPIR